MKRLFLILLLSFIALSAGAVDDLLHVKRFLGYAEVAQESLSVRDMYYWSVGTQVNGSGYIFGASQEFSSGVSQADYRICTYEDGSPIFEDGKYFFNITSRMAGVIQTIYSYDVNTCRFTLVGMLQGYKDGHPHEIVAPHVIYNRQDGMWYVFAHWEDPHHLCVGKCYRDPRYGYNEVHASLLDYEDRIKGDTLPEFLVKNKIKKVMPHTKRFSINFNRLTGKLPDWLLYHPSLDIWLPYSLVFQQEGYDQQGNMAKFDNEPANLDYYYQLYPFKKQYNEEEME